MTPAIEYFCDPLNPLGWVQEPARRRLALAIPGLEWQVRPVGMVESWEDYDGPEVAGGRPAVPATCARLSEESGMPIDEYVWFDDPPTTSWPACRAIGAAGLQGTAVAVRALRACREATFVRRRSLSDPDQRRRALEAVPGLDMGALGAALDDGRAEEAFAGHREAAAALDVPGVIRTGDRVELPTLVVRDTGTARGVSGPAGFDAYANAVAAVTGWEVEPPSPAVETVLERFSPEGWVSVTELATITGRPAAVADSAARALVDDGTAIERSFAASSFFRLARVGGDDRVAGTG